MNQIQQLINQMCPNGVEWKTLGEVCNFVNGFAFKSSSFRQSGSRIIRITNIDGVNINTVDSIYFDSNDYKEDLSKYIIKQGDIAIAMSGATTGKIGRYIDNDNSYINQRVGLFKPKQNLFNSYLYHFLLSKTNDINILAGGGAQPNLSSNSLMAKVKIPLPPLAIQTRIVEILDHFTNLTANLTVELNLRRKQFEHYREKLLSLDGVEGVEWKKLGEVGTFFTGVTGKSKKDFDNGNAKFISYMNVFSNPKLKIDVDDTIQINEGEKQNTLQYGDVIFTTSSETPDESGMSSVLTTHTDEKIYLNSFCFGFRFNNLEIISPDFYSYIFRSEPLRNQIIKCANGVTRFNISKASFAKVKILLPPLATQHSIVSILDKFTALIENIEKELALRQKQYEHYREQLLTF